MDVRLAARYPFLKDSAKYLRDQGVTLDKLVTGRAYESARLRGRDRVLEILEGNIIQDHPMATEVEATLELLSYPVARMIVSTVADPMFVKRYAIAEAKRARRWLKAAELEFVVRAAGELGLQVTREDGDLAVDFSDFLNIWGGDERAQSVLGCIVKNVDVLVGNEEGLQRGLGIPGPDLVSKSKLNPGTFIGMIDNVVAKFPGVRDRCYHPAGSPLDESS